MGSPVGLVPAVTLYHWQLLDDFTTVDAVFSDVTASYMVYHNVWYNYVFADIV